MNKKKKIIGVAAVLAVCLAIAIPVGRGKFNFDDKFKIAGNFKANSSKNDAENGESGDVNNIDGNIGSDSSKDSVSDGKNQDSNSPNGNNDSGSNSKNNGKKQSPIRQKQKHNLWRNNLHCQKFIKKSALWRKYGI